MWILVVFCVLVLVICLCTSPVLAFIVSACHPVYLCLTAFISIVFLCLSVTINCCRLCLYKVRLFALCLLACVLVLLVGSVLGACGHSALEPCLFSSVCFVCLFVGLFACFLLSFFRCSRPFILSCLIIK